MVFEGIIDFIALNYRGKVVEAASGNFFKVAEELQTRGLDVLCVDIRDVKRPQTIKFLKDDLFSPNPEIYENSALIYSLRPPQELFNPILLLSKKVGADCLIRPLPGDIPDGCRLINYKGDFFFLSQSHPRKRLLGSDNFNSWQRY